jgi:hypothetical protein
MVGDRAAVNRGLLGIQIDAAAGHEAGSGQKGQ